MRENIMTTMTTQIDQLIAAIKSDYNRNGTPERMINEFNEGLTYTSGKKYIKVMANNSVWGFIVNVEDDKMFRKGDILKAAGAGAPARNTPRGNILDGGYNIAWTGPQYLV